MAKASPLAPVPTFAGFPKSAPAFFHELSHEMNRDWFLDHKDRYQREWVGPMTALLAAVQARLAPVYRPQVLTPKIMRIHRDVRFAKDKTPYKTHIGAVLTVDGKRVGEGGMAAIYVHLGLEEEMIGCGAYQFDAAQLARWRKAVVGKPGDALVPIIAKLRKAGYQVGGHDDYKKVPKGFAPEHPRAELLKQRGLTGMVGELPRGILHQAKLATWLGDHAAALTPLVRWLHQHVG